MATASFGPLSGRQILVGLSGSIAAYKAAELVRLLTTAGASVQVAMTPAAQQFIAPLTFQALSGRPVVTDMFAGTGSPDGMEHIAAVRAADLYVIAPATATTVARLAQGSAEEPVAALASAAICPVLVVPAMNAQMWAKDAVTRNLKLLHKDGYHILAPTAGDLACGEYGPGRLNEPADIVRTVFDLLAIPKQVLAGRKVVVSAGATQEAIDAMRVITNRSSGRMGTALAAAARDAGAEVHLLAGKLDVPIPPGLAQTDTAITTTAMAKVAKQACKTSDCFISVAAIADYRPLQQVKTKLPRHQDMHLALTATPDIIASIAASNNAPYTVAFAAEDGNLAAAIKKARTKMQNKGVDAIVASPLASNLGGDDCDLALLAHGRTTRLGKLSKTVAAGKIIGKIANYLPE